MKVESIVMDGSDSFPGHARLLLKGTAQMRNLAARVSASVFCQRSFQVPPPRKTRKAVHHVPSECNTA
jgi:hypothetical protein